MQDTTNYFSDRAEDIRVDDEGLHLTISKRDGRWYCTEAILDTSLGYGIYRFRTHGRADTIDPMMVLGLFAWDGAAKEQNHREMDIEFTRWGDAGEYTNAQYAVPPCNKCPGCDDRCTRFRVNLTDGASNLTSYLIWSPGTVECRTYHGHHIESPPPASALVHRWKHISEYVPDPGNENIRFNFWLHEGNAPAGDQGCEVVITNFTWQAGPGDLNRDGRITTADAAIALKLAASGEWRADADISRDGRVTSLDALMIAQAAAGRPGLLPAELH